MLTIRSAQMKAMSTGNRPNIVPCSKSWIEIELIDADGKPVAGARFEIDLPDGSTMHGSLDEKGLARYDGIMSGQCTVRFPDYDGKEWDPA